MMTVLKDFAHIVRPDEPLAMYNWFQLGGNAQWFAEPGDVDELAALIRAAGEEKLPLRIIGRGSNILIRDEGVSGLVIALSSPSFRNIEIDGKRITAGGGARLGRVVTSAVHAGLAGIEELVAVPGTIGGALYGNAGTHGSDIGQWTVGVTVMNDNGKISHRTKEEMAFGYRQSSLKDDLVILEATLELTEEDPQELSRRMQKQWIIRKAKQPMGHQCAGCVFKNPSGMHAGELIDRAGLKGTRIGGAVISSRHANFIIAEPECTAADVLRLIEFVREQIEDRMEVELELEIEVW
jgi:UDP-N-acetylmuramate dehydrogenase